jgi:murein DD-endopeptidase MepM/ murein hydrolase activator NlpD
MAWSWKNIAIALMVVVGVLLVVTGLLFYQIYKRAGQDIPNPFDFIPKDGLGGKTSQPERELFNDSMELPKSVENKTQQEVGRESGVRGTEFQRVPIEWVDDVFVQPLPEHASPVRLRLPVELDEIVLTGESGFQGFGAHINDRIEGVEVVSFRLKPGTKIKNMADGSVVEAVYEDSYRGCQIQIDYGNNLQGRHHFLKECLVEKGQEVKAGDILGEGNTIGDSEPSFEFLLADGNRNDGVRSEFHHGQAVSMFDYLNERDQNDFIGFYKQKIITPYIAKGENTQGVFLWEPYLTNPMLLHEEHPGQLAGEWLSTQKWEAGGYPDILAFLDVENQYWTGRYMRAIDVYNANYVMRGNWKVTGNKVLIEGVYGTYYGIFEVDESGELAKLKFEYSEQGYPQSFSDNAVVYVERKPICMYDQGIELGAFNYGLPIDVENKSGEGKTTIQSGNGIPVEWVDDVLTQPLHPSASKTRLHLPALPQDLMPAGSQIVGYGAHAGQHIEGLDHTWIPVRKGVHAKSMGDGTVIGIEEHSMNPPEYMVNIDFGGGLYCVYAEMYEIFVEKGDKLKYLDPIGKTNTMGGFDDIGEIEIYCEDENIVGGLVSSNGHGYTSVSVFDYLTPEDKKVIEDLYTEKVLDPYLATGVVPGEHWNPIEPYLTNKIIIHEPYMVEGEWYLVDHEWTGEPFTLLTIIKSENKYYTGNKYIFSAEDHHHSITNQGAGTYEVTYTGKGRGTLKLDLRDWDANQYALFEITEDAGTDIQGIKRAQMKFELDNDPVHTFSDKALTYQARGNYNPRYEAYKKGFLKMQ